MVMQPKNTNKRSVPVVFVDGYYEFYLDDEMVYDFQPASMGDALRWIQHLSQKSWMTCGHLGLFAQLVADQFGQEYR